MATTRYLVVVYVVTSGLTGDDLGSDEQEIVLFTWLVVDITNCKVIAVHCKPVKLQSADINENILSEVAKGQFGLTEDIIKGGQPLDTVLEEFDQYAKSKLHSESGRGGSFHVIIDGANHLRQVLHPEACRKGITLPDYLHSFYDLRKEFTKFYRNNDIQSIDDMISYLCIEADGSADCAIRKVQNMAKVILRLINDGHKFKEPEVINERLEPGICNKHEQVDGSTVVRARGLPWQSSDQDIAKFFKGLNIVKGGVALCLSPQGRRNGEALVRFVSQEHRDMALKRHKHHIGQRYIEVYRANGDDFVSVAGGNNNEAQQFLSRGGQVIVRMRGLPYDCTAQQVMDFFAGKQPCDILHGEDGVLFVRKADGRATGDAFVLFDTEEMASKALLKHREVIGARYIELFRSSTAEVQQVLNRTMELVRPFEQPASYPMMNNSMNSSNLAPLGIHPHMLSQARKDCIRLRGLPYEALVEQILEFLGDNSKNIVYQGVHMVYNAQGQPSGEAFIQMNSEGAAAMAANQCHHKYMACMNAQTQVKKQRYIEVFQCSIDDMNMVLTGGAVPAPTMPRQLLSPGGSLLPAYGGGFPYLQSPPTVLPSQAAQAAAASGGLGALSPPGGRVSAGSYGPPHHQAPPPHYPPQSVLYWPYPSPPVSPFFNCYKVADCI
ncbi:Epithelial splicing regulatory protein 2 [Halotydeus destructor]|nr:Epithelial splicing regulatory protein 2 [Halotydeus destructor]